MIKLITIILLVATCIAYLGSIGIMARDPGRDLEIEEFLLSTWNGMVAVLCVTALTFIVRWMIQVQLSAQILLSFFFYSWRNSIYDENVRRFSALFYSLETERF